MRDEMILVAIAGLRDQVEKRHFLNAHFRAFEIADMAWKEHIRVNAEIGAASVSGPRGAILSDEEIEKC